jgi:hypothetical protein
MAGSNVAMTCDEIREWLGPYLDDEVAAEARRAVDAHVSACAECSRELKSLRALADRLAQPDGVRVPPELWPAIEARLPATTSHRHRIIFTFRRMAAVAAVLLIAVGVGLFALPWGWDGARSAQAATVDFAVLLDGLKMDPDRAFDAFLAQYQPEEVSPAEARAYAPDLTFALPNELPGGFQRVAAYKLHFGNQRGIAARYMRGSELLGFVFHPPLLQMRFGERENRSCTVGMIQGHAVDVGEWTLSHLTDPTTCHCVLTKLDRTSELPAVYAAIAPGCSFDARPAGHGHP